MNTNVGTELSLLQRLRIAILGVSQTQLRTRPGWHGSLMFFAFKCPDHGLVENYPQGYLKVLHCPVCESNSKKKEFRQSRVKSIFYSELVDKY